MSRRSFNLPDVARIEHEQPVKEVLVSGARRSDYLAKG
jgi:hypothetical protein